MVTIGIGEVESSICFDEPGNRDVLVDSLTEMFEDSRYVLTDISVYDEGQIVDIHIDGDSGRGYVNIKTYVSWLEKAIERLA